jgi:hypothetical protein
MTALGVDTASNSTYGAGQLAASILMLGMGGLGDVASLAGTAADEVGTAAEAANASGAARVFTSADPHVADAANAIERAMPGRVLGVNDPNIPMLNGLTREADINLGNLLVQVKSGPARGLIGQVARTADTTGIRTAGYGPSMSEYSWATAAEQGIPIARNIDELLAMIREFG